MPTPMRILKAPCANGSTVWNNGITFSIIYCMETQSVIGLTHKEIVKLDRDYEKAAKSVNLIYVNDCIPGITRQRKGNGFVYLHPSKKVLTNGQLERIKKLVIPPAWEKVWICPDENGHLQATGYDQLNRKQYRYHSLWGVARSETKFHKMFEFGKRLPVLRERLQQDLSNKQLSREKVIAAIISLMERTYIRVGNEDYEKKYGSRGITTLHNNHVTIGGEEIKFSFTGKKNVPQSIKLRNKRLARIVKQCRDIPGNELFQYYDENGNRHPVDSGMVNDYLKETFQAEFTAKDFRTWAGTLNFLLCLKSLQEPVNETSAKRNILFAYDEVSRKLGNTRAVCRKYYVHPQVAQLYESGKLLPYLKKLPDSASEDTVVGLSDEENVLMRILKLLN
jgi:DNA topoisomerase-1